MKTQNYTYIVECSDGKLYTGWTTCIQRRLLEHNSGRGAKFTRYKIPVQLRYLEVSETKSEAMKREAQIKQLKRSQKLKLIAQGHLEKILSENHISI